METLNINAKATAANTFDAIVVGSGISGGWAAKELCDAGLKTLVLDRGRNVEHLKDYPTMMKAPWEFEHRGRMTQDFLKENPLISKAAGFAEDTAHFFIKDKDHPYVQDKPFDWIRGYQVGGKSITWGRACQRWSNHEFEAPAKLGYGADWPIRYKDVAPWYSHVEKFIGVCGNKDGIDAMPDGEFLPPFEFPGRCVFDEMPTLMRDWREVLRAVALTRETYIDRTRRGLLALPKAGEHNITWSVLAFPITLHDNRSGVVLTARIIERSPALYA